MERWQAQDQEWRGVDHGENDGDHGVLSLSNFSRANIVVSYWRRKMARICHLLLCIRQFLEE